MSRRVRPTADLTDEYLRCRAIGHAWDDFNPINKRPPSFGWLMAFRCTRCFTERSDLIDSLGRLITRYYVYHDDYREAGIGTRGVPRNQFRAELAIRRFGRARKQRVG